ncbi:MAG: efflux RND transporter periplasmic adaptor subunit [Deltaproteobacteria bacterium]|jgi:HlyD family secretion protein|nr:efflux RND transporter periplasmic adaptor subunit [Deltaproteobacteria bacterium]
MRKAVAAILLLLAAGIAVRHGLPAERGEAVEYLTLYGNVEPREVSLSFRVAGRLQELTPEEGDRLAEGDRVAALDREPYENQLRVSEAQISEIEAQLANAEKSYERLRSLLEKGSAAQSDYDGALALRDQMKASLETGKAQLAIARTALDDATLFSPASGTVITRVHEPGEMIGAGDTVCVLSLDSPVWIRAYLEEPELGRVHPGKKVTVKTDSGGVYPGTVGFISPKAEFTPKTVETPSLRTSLVYRIRVAVEGPERGLRHGMPVTVEVREEDGG